MKNVEIKIEGKEWEEALDAAFKKANAKVKIDGFRQGKAPKDIFLKKYGKESLYFDAADAVIGKAYEKMLEDNKDLKIVAQPEINVKSIDENGVVFNFGLTLRPEVTLGKYKGLKVKKDEVKVTKEEVKNALKEMQNRYAEVVVKDGAVENGDTAVIDFEGFKDGKAFDGGKGENYSLKIGSNTFIPGFEEQLIGLKAGEEKDVNVTFPEDYHAEDLKGQPALFKVKVNEVKTTIIPELDKEFFADLGMEGIDTVEALEKELEANIHAHKDMDAENKYIDELLAAAGKNVKCDIPETMIKDEVTRMLNQYEEHLKMQGLTLEQFYQFTQSNEDALRDQMKEEATNRVLYRLMLEEIVKAENIEATKDEINEEADKMSKRYNMTKEEFIKAFGGEEMVKYDIEMRKAIEVLKEAK